MGVITTHEEQGAALAPEAEAQEAAAERRNALRDAIGWLASPSHLFVAGLSLLPLLFLIVLVLDKGVNMPFEDEWDSSARIAIKAAEGTLQISDLWMQNNEHRSFITHLMTTILVYTTRWNLEVGLYVLIAAAALTLVFLAGLLRRHDSRALVLALAPFSLLMFSFRQYANWSMNFQIGWYALLLFFVVALWALKRPARGWLPVIVAALMAHLMLFSTFHGIVGYPLLGAALWLLGYRRRRYYVFWLAALAFSLAWFFIGYDFSVMGANEEGQSAGLVRDPIKIVYYAIVYLGNGFVPQASGYVGVAVFVAIGGLLLGAANAAYLWWKTRSLSSIAVWLVMAAFAVGVAFVTAFGRSHVFPQLIPYQPLISRYVTPPLPLWFAFTALASLAVGRILRQPERRPGEMALVRVNVLAAIVLIGLYFNANIPMINAIPRVSPPQFNCVLNYPASRNTGCLDYLYLKDTSLLDVIQRIDRLSILQLSAFAGREPLFADIQYLYNAQTIVIQETGDAYYRYYNVTDSYEPAVFYQPAPGQVEFVVTIPQGERPVRFVAGVYVDSGEASDASEPPDGVLFRVGVRDANGDPRLLGEAVFDPNVDERYKAVRYSLDEYRGQTVRLILQTGSRDNPDRDLSMWIDPVIVVLDQ